MKIDSGTIQMNAGRFYTQSTEQTKNVTAQNAAGTQSYQASASFLQTYTCYSGTAVLNAASKQYDSYEPSTHSAKDLPAFASDLYTNLSGTNISLVDVKSTLEDFRQKLIDQLEEFMERIREQLLGLCNYRAVNKQRDSSASTYSYTHIQQTTDTYIVDLTTQSQKPGNLWNIQTTNQFRQSEAETTTFVSTGSVQTADGREINFNISMEMSRSFMEESSQLSNRTKYILTDPLVIQLEDVPDTISDQKWFFDMDCDGKKEEISELTKGNAFLALDANDNGIVDDGKELFGTKSGNGFQDLAAFDEDGNGWIDENDSVYTKLKIWTKDSSGNDKLMNLQQADIGAIYLSYADTEFTHKTTDTNETNAVVRETGFYLHESTGTAGIIQQIDFATGKSA